MLLYAFAEKNKGKYGSDEDMFAALRQEYEREKTPKRRLIIAFASAAAVLIAGLAIMLPFLLKGKGTIVTPPVHEIVDGLTVVPVAEAELKDGLGFEPVIPRPEGYNLNIIKIYKNGENEIKAYYFKYENIIETATTVIEIRCVLNNDFVFSMEEKIDKYGEMHFIFPNIVNVYIDDKNNSLSSVVKGDKYIVSLQKHDAALLSELIQQLKI